MKLKDYLLAAAAALAMLGFVLQPSAALQAARQGLELFLAVVLPSILPFMVCAWLLIESGAVAAAGRQLNRVMRPVFACPGPSAFALMVSMLSGYPTGARITSELYDKGLLSPADASRTGILASSTGPVFMLGAVGAGLLGNPAAGWLIVISHFSAVLITGIIFSMGGNRKSENRIDIQPVDTSPVMESVGVAIKKTVDTLWTVGGYIILFSVITALLRQYNVLLPLSWAVSPVLRLVGMSPTLAEPLVIGAFELTNGCNAVATSAAPLQQRCIAIAMLVSWGGLCIQAQSMLYLSKASVGAGKFLLGKAVQSIVAFAVCSVLISLPAFNQAVCMAGQATPVFSAPEALAASTWYAAGLALAVILLAFFNGRASARGSA
jgi:sporulation integral membrane protein YlbJ